MIAQAADPQATCLVEPGIICRATTSGSWWLIAANRLGGFHFNDFKFADYDLSAGSTKPYQLSLIFNEPAMPRATRR